MSPGLVMVCGLTWAQYKQRPREVLLSRHQPGYLLSPTEVAAESALGMCSQVGQASQVCDGCCTLSGLDASLRWDLAGSRQAQPVDFSKKHLIMDFTER